MEDKDLGQKLADMKEALKKRNVIVIDDVIPGHPAYGFLEAFGSGKERFLYAFHYQDKGRFSNEFLKPFREDGHNIENCEDLAKASIDPKNNYFYDSTYGSFIPSKDINKKYCWDLKINEEEFRKRTGIGNAYGIIVIGRQPDKDKKNATFVHEGFHGLDIDYNLAGEGEGWLRKFFSLIKSSEVVTDMRTIAFMGDDLKTEPCYVKGGKQTHNYIRRLLAGKGDLIKENQKVIMALYEQFDQDAVFQDFAASQLYPEWSGAGRNIKSFKTPLEYMSFDLSSFKTALKCMAFEKPLNLQNI